MNDKPLALPWLMPSLKILISLASLAFILHYFWFKFPSHIHVNQFLHDFGFTLPVLFFAMCINWSVESFKWKTLLSTSENISFTDALKAVLSGITIGLFTPNRTGEYVGRLWYVKHKMAAVTATIAGNISQLAITLLLGLVGLAMMPAISRQVYDQMHWTWIMVVFIMLMLGVFMFRKKLFKWLEKSRFSLLQSFFDHWKALTPKQWISAVGLSTLRYTSFWIPFVWLLSEVYDAGMLTLFWIVPVSYLIQAFIPAFAIAEIGTRAFVIGWVAGQQGLDPDPAILASIAIWLINVILPSLAGLYFIWKIPTPNQ